MNDLYFFILTAINLFVLGFMCVLVHMNDTLNPKQTNRFLLTFILIGAISLLEMLTVLVDGAPVWLRFANILTNYLGFALTPAVPIVMVYTLSHSNRIKASFKIAVIVELLYVLLLTISLFFNGLVYKLDETNHNTRHA